LLPLCAFAAVGLDLAMTRARWSAVPLLVLLGTWALVSYGAMWVGAGSPRALAYRALVTLSRGANQDGVAMLREAVTRDPADWTSQEILTQFVARHGATRQELKKLLGEGRRLEPDLTGRHVALGQLAAQEGDLARAVAEARRSIALSPDMPEGHLLEAQAREARGEAQAAIAAWREVLRIDPFASPAHQALARLLAATGAADSAQVHRAFVARLSEGSR